MKNIIVIFGLYFSLIPLWSQEPDTLFFNSGNKRVQLLELFTSQGCSSCPPAERWINSFSSDQRLWQEVVPVVFHVDYWDRLGWKDPFGSSENTQRQYTYQRQGRADRIYTPGFLVNGWEWRGWFDREKLPNNSETAPNLKGFWVNDRLEVFLKNEEQSPLTLHIAVLGMGLKTNVTRGENRNRTLSQQFVVLSYQTHLSDNHHWSQQINLENLTDINDLAIAIWVTAPNGFDPLQASGFFLK